MSMLGWFAVGLIGLFGFGFVIVSLEVFKVYELNPFLIVMLLFAFLIFITLLRRLDDFAGEHRD